MSLRIVSAVAVTSVAVGIIWGCGSTPPSGFLDGNDAGSEAGNDEGGDPWGTVDGGGADVHQCRNLECQQVNCGNGSTTSVSGTVYAPNGTLPLYNVIVYVPNAPLDPITQGVTCDQCGVLSSGSPLVVTLTDAKGHFQLDNVPVGASIPLVMQVGKWRRQITIPTVTQCTNNAVGQKSGGVESLTRLPKNQKEGSMPKVAITTGGCDDLACIMPKIGIDPAEYAPGPTNAATKPKTAFSFYAGSGGQYPGGGTPAATPFWNDTKQLSNFDIAIFSCECYEATPDTKDQTSWNAVLAYLEAGGRIFTTDFQYTWYKDSKDKNLNNPPWSWPGGAPFQGSPFTIDQSFPKGKALADWLYYVSSIAPYNAQTTQPPIKGQFPVMVPFGNIASINPKYGTNWATGSDSRPKFVTMNEPSAQPPAKQCGKGVHLDAHVSAGDSVTSSFPSGCNSTIKETELATVFFFFDLSSCIQSDTAPVVVPVPN
jgi:hypothetical protein